MAHASTEGSDAAVATGPVGRKVNRSCLECTRRKVKCDGKLPCGSCVYYRNPDVCGYRQRSKRNAVSRSTLDKATEKLHTQAQVLETLFPGLSVSDLLDKTQTELLDLLPIRVPPHIAAGSGPPHPEASLSSNNGANDSAPMSDNGEAPEERQWDESLNQTAPVATDDINAIGLATDHHARSYLGMTSMNAIVRAIFRLCPPAKEHTAQCARAWAIVQPPALPSMTPFGRDPALGPIREQRCIDFYFEQVHAVAPLLDEDDFRRTYASGARHDASWMGLLNMVFTVGSIASGSDSLHEQYYRQARSYLNLDSLGSGNLDSLQALCILGGYYLHYRNSPNMAYSVLGAAHRVAIGLGLHREPRRRSNITDPIEAEHYRRRLETGRRTWWSFFCLDTWGCMTQGRPTCGRWDNTVMDTMLPSPLYADDHAALSLRASAEFCLICDRIQHRFAQFSRLSLHEVLSFDSEIEQWWNALPPILIDPASLPPRFHLAREFMRNRYHNVRVILSRTPLLYIGNDFKRRTEQISPDQLRILDMSCEVASRNVESVALYWTPNRIHVWNSSWYMFQACMVPLLSLALARNTQQPLPPESLTAWRATVEKALETFAEMRPWMRASDRSPDIVSALYEALTTESDGTERTPSNTDCSLDFLGWYDDQVAELDWSILLGEESLAQGMIPVL